MGEKYRKRKSKKGFTLVELLIVIAIIGILCVLALPSLMGSITKAKKARVLTHGSGVYTTILSEMTGRSPEELTKEEIVKLAQVPGKILEMKFAEGELSKLLYKEDNLIAKYENKNWSVGTENSQEGNYFGGSYTMEAIRAALATCDKERLGSMSGNGVEELKAANIDLEKNGIKTWYYDKSRGLLALSPQDFKNEESGNRLVIIYDYNSKTYSLKYTVVEGQNNLVRFDKDAINNIYVPKEKIKEIEPYAQLDNYEDALSAYEKITK